MVVKVKTVLSDINSRKRFYSLHIQKCSKIQTLFLLSINYTSKIMYINSIAWRGAVLTAFLYTVIKCRSYT